MLVAITLLALAAAESQRRILVDKLRKTGADRRPIGGDDAERLNVLAAIFASALSTIAASFLFALLLLQVSY